MALAILLPCVLATRPSAQDADPTALLAEAERAAEAGEPERATRILWTADAAVDPFSEETSARILRTSIHSVLAKVDPLNDQRTAARAEIAGELLGLARCYVRKRWYRTAHELLSLAGRYDAPTAMELMPYVEKRLADLPADVPDIRESPEPDEPVDLLTCFEPDTVVGEWWRRGEVWTSPPLDGSSSPRVLTRAHQHADHRIAVDVRIGDRAGKASFAFGVTEQQDYFLCELYHLGPGRSSIVSLHYYDPAAESQQAEELGECLFQLSAAERADFVTIEVLVRGEKVEVRAHGKQRLIRKLQRAPRGGVGLLVSGNSDNVQPVEFRNFTIGPLPPEEPAEAPPPEQPFLDAIAAAEERIAAGEVEPALLELREMRGDLESLESEALREGIEAEIERLHEEHDPCARARQEAHVAIAGHHAALAEAYRASGWLLCAWTEIREARALHADTAGDLLAAIQPEIRTLLEREEGLPPEADEPTDHAELIETFADGRTHWSLGEWTFEPGAVLSPVLVTGRALVLEPRGRDPRSAASVQYRVVSGEGGAGIVFAAKNMHDFWMAHLVHRPEGSTLKVAHWFVNEWKFAYQQRLEFSQPAREGFTTLGFEILDGKVRIRAGTAEPIVVEAENLVPDRVGLVATADLQREARVAFRNFRTTASVTGRDH